jgi:RNA polymerase sigma factor (sigma-70 family)
LVITVRSPIDRGPAPAARWGDDDAIANIPDPRPDPSAAATAAERSADLMERVRRLTPALRETVVLTLEGLSHQEIAEVLGTTPRTVAVRLTRARAALARVLAAEEAEEAEEER